MKWLYSMLIRSQALATSTEILDESFHVLLMHMALYVAMMLILLSQTVTEQRDASTVENTLTFMKYFNNGKTLLICSTMILFPNSHVQCSATER